MIYKVFGVRTMLKGSKSVAIIMIITIASKMLGFTRELTLAALFGTTAYTDAYLVAITIPMVVFVIFGGALGTAFIPLYTDIAERRDREYALLFTNNVLNMVAGFALILCLAGSIFVRPLVRLFAVGFEKETLDLTVEFTRIMLPGICFIGINYILTAYLHANKRFAVPALVSLPGNAIIILCIFLSYLWNRRILIYGTLLSILIQLLIQLHVSLRVGYRYKLKIKLKDQSIKRMGYLVIPTFLGMAAGEINVLIDRTLASTLNEGSIAALNFAGKLNWFVFEVFIASIATVSYPALSGFAARADTAALRDWISRSIKIIFIIVVPISAGAMCLSTPIVRTLFQRGAFDARATYLTSTALFYYSLGMTGLGIREILTKAFYALQDARTAMKNGIFVVAVNIILNLLLIEQMGHGGLALATSISSLAGAAVLLYKLRLKVGAYGERDCLIILFKACGSAVFMVSGVKLFYRCISAPALFLPVLFGGLIYFVTLKLMKVEEVDDLISAVKRKLKGFSVKRVSRIIMEDRRA